MNKAVPTDAGEFSPPLHSCSITGLELYKLSNSFVFSPHPSNTKSKYNSNLYGEILRNLSGSYLYQSAYLFDVP